MQSRSNLDPPIWRSSHSLQGENQINIGKWNEQEKKIFNAYHELFEPLSTKYELMTKYIRTRTPCQIRSHWQKVMEKMQREKQKIGRTLPDQDIAQGKYNFEHGLRDFSISASDSTICTEGVLLNPIAIQLKSMVNNLEKPSCRQTRSKISRRQEKSRGIQQQWFEGMRRVENYIIVGPPSEFALQQRDQLQNFGKINENSNASSNIESMQRQKNSYEKQNFVFYLNFQHHTKRTLQ